MPTCGDRFNYSHYSALTPLYSFYNQAHKKVQHLDQSFAKMEDAYREACLMFSESPKATDPADFFGLFRKFITEWKVCTFMHMPHNYWL